MRQALMLCAAATMLLSLIGCACPGGNCGPGFMTGTCYDAPETCAGCTGGCTQCVDSGAQLGGGMHGRGMAGNPCGDGCGMLGGLGRRKWQAPHNPGPATGAITYPYYTLRGPRDFLASNPRSIGP